MTNEIMIFPKPKQFEIISGSDVVLGRKGKCFLQLILQTEINDDLIKNAFSLIDKHMAQLIGNQSRSLYYPSETVKIIFDIKQSPPDVSNPEQAYLIEVKDGAVEVTGFGVAGLYYAAITLKQCLRLKDGEVRLPCMKIKDWPDKKIRGHLMESRFGTDLMDLDDWKQLVDHMSEMKFNVLQVNVYGCWSVQYDGKVSEYIYIPVKEYPELRTSAITKYYSAKKRMWIEDEQLTPMFEQDFLGKLIAYGKTRGIKVYPGFNSYGHNTLIPSKIPEISAIDENDEPTLTGFCTSNPKTYELLFLIYDEIIDKYLLPNGIDSIHIGLDEVLSGMGLNAHDVFKIRSSMCKCSKCRDQEPGSLFIQHAIKIISYLKKRGMKHISMYGDMLINRAGYGIGQLSKKLHTELYKNDLLKEVVIFWWTYRDIKERLMFQSTQPELGMRSVTTPWNGYYNWVMLINPLKNIYLLAEMAMKDNTEGIVSYSSWDKSYDRNHACLAEYSWNFAGTGTPQQMTDRYIMRNFTSQISKARRAFKLFDIITEERIETFDGPVSVVCNNFLLSRKLSSYFYTYVKKNKPYPRIFPGEALELINERREDYEKAINEIASMAKESKELWEEIALDARCNTEIASRYAYEAENYLCIAEDYLTLLYMMDIASTEYENKFECIKKMAGERKLARLNLMLRLEKTKEKFLLPIQMRNHSIYMQFFSDLEFYIAKNEDGDIRLDFFDMRYIESEEFKNLR